MTRGRRDIPSPVGGGCTGRPSAGRPRPEARAPRAPLPTGKGFPGGRACAVTAGRPRGPGVTRSALPRPHAPRRPCGASAPKLPARSPAAGAREDPALRCTPFAAFRGARGAEGRSAQVFGKRHGAFAQHGTSWAKVTCSWPASSCSVREHLRGRCRACSSPRTCQLTRGARLSSRADSLPLQAALLAAGSWGEGLECTAS